MKSFTYTLKQKKHRHEGKSKNNNNNTAPTTPRSPFTTKTSYVQSILASETWKVFGIKIVFSLMESTF